jgi:hypothetical protein
MDGGDDKGVTAGTINGWDFNRSLFERIIVHLWMQKKTHVEGIVCLFGPPTPIDHFGPIYIVGLKGQKPEAKRSTEGPRVPCVATAQGGPTCK